MYQKNDLRLNLVAVLTAVSGLVTLGNTLIALVDRHGLRTIVAEDHLTVAAGLGLIYLASLLRRGKYNAWLISLPVFIFLLARASQHFVVEFGLSRHLASLALGVALPAVTLALLIIFGDLFKVRSEIRSFTAAVRRSVIILLIAFLYGVIGFAYMDDRDFHQELSVGSEAHYVVDQFGLTTNRQLVPYTRRARLFLNSLEAISIAAVTYTAVSFFAPIRFRLHHNSQERLAARRILNTYSRTSEDFFKLWPRDKAYYFSANRRAVVAYKVVSGVALVVGDAVGPAKHIQPLLEDFIEYCRLNDWGVAFIHTDGTNRRLYQKLGFELQKIGQEALVDLAHFNAYVATNKYFRHISNKFTKQNFVFKLLSPPHSSETVAELKRISDEWLERPGRSEYSFMMGYFDENYVQNCRLAVLTDENRRLVAFLNQVPTTLADEASYDFLRQRGDAPGNTTDFLMINLAQELEQEGIKRINMGLSPLTGLEPDDFEGRERTTIDSLLHFAYGSADRFYSFRGLARFKSKYEPDWEDRYIVYRGGLPGFTRTMNALLRAMRHK